MLRCERAKGRRDTAVALCDSGEEGLRYLLFFKSGCRGRARGLQKLMGAKVKVLLLDEPRCERYAPSSRSRSALGVMKCAVSPVSVATQSMYRPEHVPSSKVPSRNTSNREPTLRRPRDPTVGRAGDAAPVHAKDVYSDRAERHHT